jgi:uncharacterized protein
MNVKKIYFYADHYRLHGNLHFPENMSASDCVPVVIGSHGLLSDGESPKQKAIAEKLNKRGIAYFRFDHRGRGQSDGTFSEVTTFQGRINDMAAAISTITAHPGIKNTVGLFGSSMGGPVCIGTAKQLDIKTVVTLAAPVRLQSIRIPPDISEDPLFRGMDPVQLSFDISDQLPDIRNILIFHGDADEVVSYADALEIFDRTCFPKKLVSFPGGDHAISDPLYQQQFIDQTVEWLESGLRGDQISA